jgi:methionyl-tRNA formyltransferase
VSAAHSAPPRPIVIATPHERYAHLIGDLGALLHGSQVFHVRSPEELSYERLCEIDPEYIFFPHWSWFIPESIFGKFTCVIFHMTDLPYGRGGSPLQNLIVRGHRDTQLSALKCSAELDAGPIYLKRPMLLDGTAEEILQRASGLILEMIVEIAQVKPAPTEQEGPPVYFQRRNPEDGDLGPAGSVNSAYDFIRMLDAAGYPRAFLETQYLRFEFEDAELHGDHLEAKVKIHRKSDD